jgi:hypothetical protein
VALPIDNGVGSAFANAAMGLQRGSNQITQASSDIARSSAGSQSGEFQGGVKMTDALIDLQVGAINVQASSRALGAADDTLGTLLDTFA